MIKLLITVQVIDFKNDSLITNWLELCSFRSEKVEMDDLGATSHCIKETAIYIMAHKKYCASFGLITIFFYFGELCQKCPLNRSRYYIFTEISVNNMYK